MSVLKVSLHVLFCYMLQADTSKVMEFWDLTDERTFLQSVFRFMAMGLVLVDMQSFAGKVKVVIKSLQTTPCNSAARWQAHGDNFNNPMLHPKPSKQIFERYEKI